jgi:hypothetical protein
MAKKRKTADSPGGLSPGFDTAPSPRRWEDVLDEVEAVQTPTAARHLGEELQRLARLCLVLANDAGGEPFTLGTQLAAEVMGSPDYADGGAGLRVLVAAGLIVLVKRGTPGKGCSTWRRCAPDNVAPGYALSPWAQEDHRAAAAVAAWS